MNSNNSTNESEKRVVINAVHTDDNEAAIKHDAELLADFLYQLFKESRGC
ncbi:hypothetical protein IKF25_02165 [Candidatus Saccharibacteria bacterium]|nr:hypothetical protein [Candidatus Saccharibacteria bacterium]